MASSIASFLLGTHASAEKLESFPTAAVTHIYCVKLEHFLHAVCGVFVSVYIKIMALSHNTDNSMSLLTKCV